jgi:hypothetical protein
MAVTYNPLFHHPGWVDNVDRVRAGGDNGFNFYFSAVEAEFQKLAEVVAKFDTALGSLGQQVAAPVTIGLAPLMVPFRAATPAYSGVLWSFEQPAGTAHGTFVEKPTAQATAFGVVPLDLPNGVHVRDLKVLGEHTGGGQTVTELIQESRTTPWTKTSLVTFTGLVDTTAAPLPIPGEPAFGGGQNLYYLFVRSTGAAGATVRVRGFQITYLP